MKRAGYCLLLLAAVVAAIAVGRVVQAKAPEAHRPLYYIDPMHPAYRSNKPGIAPDCGMKLVPVYAEDIGKSSVNASTLMNGGVRVDPATRQLLGIQLATVEKSAGRGSIRVFARVAADETRIYHVNLGTDGYVKETRDDAVGSYVKKDQHLAIVYSPDFLSLAGGYLSANERSPAGFAKDNSASLQGAATSQARADRLRNLGMSDSQINELSTTHKIPEDVYVVAPTNGFVISRNISPDQRFERHTELYTIADLSHVWVIAEVFGEDTQLFRPGAIARIIIPDTTEVFSARVSNALPQIDPVSRSLRIRLDVDNPRFSLRPDMYVTVELPVVLPPGLTVPRDAVLDSGLSKHVFVKTDRDTLETRKVETGWQLDDRVQIVKGLQEGDRVVSEGTFLIDSESQLQGTASSSGAATTPPLAPALPAR
ncbi:MAG TPA: efflux RND transporter periplasmic adaptor subunit [Acidobacteriaceae bacterium]